MENELQFKNNNPGAVKHGNFINYYKFHSPEERISLLPKENIWETSKGGNKLIALDIGCNTGNLTERLYDFIRKEIEINSYLLGVDIDETLIERANENKKTTNVTYKCLNFIEKQEREEVLQQYLHSHEKTKFDIVFCYSTTMWIHLNNGDEGLKDFLKTLSNISKIVVIEPQPWKCYKSALKRVKGDQNTFPNFSKLTIRNNVTTFIENYFINECNIRKLHECEETSWGRKVLIFTTYK